MAISFERRRILQAGAVGALGLPLAGWNAASAFADKRNTGDMEVARRPFELKSADGTVLSGEVDMPKSANGVAVIFGSGSGAHDRDMSYGQSNTPRDKVFRDLGARIALRGGMAVRCDRRGVRYGVTGPDRIDAARVITATTTAQVEDMRAVYDWATSPAGLGARRVVFLVHSEGMLHLGRMAASGAPAPAAVIGIGALMESPQAVLHWQMAEREAQSIASLDGNHDGIVTNDEVRAGWLATPAGLLPIEDALSPSGQWTAADVDALRARRQAAYDEAKRNALATPDTAPYPDANFVIGPYQWWKSWFTDTTPNAQNLARWNTRFHLHYGSIDSQTNAARQQAAARAALRKLDITVHPGVGHALGRHSALGPMEESIADLIARQAAMA